jgi:NDP-sugar pyrophosphorylase family protein
MSAHSAIVMAGGASTRMRADGGSHKALRLVRDRTLLEWNLRALIAHGCRDVHVAISQQANDVRGWLTGRGTMLVEQAGGVLSIHEESLPMGSVGAVHCLPRTVQHVVVVNVDNLTSLSLAEMRAHHIACGAAATIAVHQHHVRVPYGAVDHVDGWVTTYREKPLLTTTVSSGCYVLGRAAIDAIMTGERIDQPQLMARLLAVGARVSSFGHDAPWIDVNNPEELAEAVAVADQLPWRQ